MTHGELIEKAAREVAPLIPQADADPVRPRYHVTTPAGWINDPNGPIQHNGVYHLFMQHGTAATGGVKHWAHASSKDLAHWTHEPIALAPEAHAGDGDGVWSGCCVDDNGTPTAIYTGVRPEVQCIATADADLRTWTKRAAGPVITERPREDLHGFRDPYVWREGDMWRMVLGSGIFQVGGCCLLYESDDLESWQYLGPLCIGFGRNWECPMFFPLGQGRDDQWVLIISPHDQPRYAVGTYRDNRFTLGKWRPLDLADRSCFYAPNGLLDDKGRRIIWGWIRCGGLKDGAWCGALTLPRVLTLRDDGRLGVDVPEELTALRGKASAIDAATLKADDVVTFDGIDHPQHELDVTFAREGATIVGVHSGTPIQIDLKRGLITAGYLAYDFDLLDDEDQLHLRVFRDHCVTELYINGRQAITIDLSNKFPQLAADGDARVFARESSAKLLSARAWEMGGAW